MRWEEASPASCPPGHVISALNAPWQGRAQLAQCHGHRQNGSPVPSSRALRDATAQGRQQDQQGMQECWPKEVGLGATLLTLCFPLSGPKGAWQRGPDFTENCSTSLQEWLFSSKCVPPSLLLWSHCALSRSIQKNDSSVCKRGRNKRSLPGLLFMNLITLAGSPHCELPALGWDVCLRVLLLSSHPHQEGPEEG